MFHKEPLIDGLSIAFAHKGGGKSAPPPPPPQQQVAPTPPVEEASVKLEEDEGNKKLRTGKQKLKLPMSNTASTGLKV